MLWVGWMGCCYSCGGQDNPERMNPCPEPNQCQYTFFPGAQLVLHQSDSLIEGVEIKPGQQLVFRYRYQRKENPAIADDELTRLIVFQVPDTVHRFSFADEALADVQATLVNQCFCPRQYYPIRQGSLQGVRLDANRWQISLNVQVDTGFETSSWTSFQFTAVFEAGHVSQP